MLESSMDTSFYPDESCSTSYVKMRSLKQKLTLDLDGVPGAKRGKFSNINNVTGGIGLLSSPDLNMLKLASPELESLLIQQHGHVTTTPTPGQQQYIFPKTVTEEQEMYARGFVEALAELHQHPDNTYEDDEDDDQDEDPSSPSNSSSNDDLTVLNSSAIYQQQLQHQQLQQGDYPVYTDFIMPSMCIKEEPQTVPTHHGGCSRDTPPVSPIDMMAQERIKLERKRQRNRLAASKCRRRKLERIARLEDKVKLLKDDNSELSAVVAKLKDHICRLKEQLMEHVNSGCQVMSPPPPQYS